MNTNNETKRLLALLELHRSSVVADLEVQDVMPDLLAKLVLGHDDKQKIEYGKSYEERANILLDIIKRKAENGSIDSIPTFVNSLRERYSWLYLKLTQDELDFATSTTIPFSIPRIIGPDEQKIRNLLEAGGVHGLPRYTVERTDHLENIRMELTSLERRNYLVLTGMAGCGKSVLAMQALHSKLLLTDVFSEGIFWLSIGKECSDTKDAILVKMRSLCDKLGETRAPSNLESGAEFLRAAFLKRPDSLLILDDVWRSEVIRAFDIGCRTMITTRDISVMDAVTDRVKRVKVADGFTEKESLQLFCQSLGTTLAELPGEAESIHAECKGSPMVISLVSALFHDHDISDKGRWDHYLNFLRKRKFSQMRKLREYEHESIVDAISLSIDNLDAKDREYYLDFALFQDDVGIPCTVLMTLWDLGRYDVEDLMSRLVRKSLAAEEYDPQRKCKIYSLHDLQLDYVKYCLCSQDGPESPEKALHERLVDRYLRHCGNYFEKLPDDGYIHSFIGYHLYKAKMTEYFPKIYLNLLFVGEKMRIAGAADLLIDLRKYKEFIIGNTNEEEEKRNSNLLEEITTFAQSAGHRIYNQADADVVQIALEMPHLSKIYAYAKEIARKSPNRLYLEWSNASSDQWKSPESVTLCTDNVRCIKFVDENHFLAALSNGCIELCNLASCRICHIYSGHGDTVQVIDVFNGQENWVFVSGSEDKTCKLWNVKPFLKNTDWDKNNQRSDSSPSPRIRQDFWAGFDKSQDESFLTFEFHTSPVLHSEFSFDGTKIISTSLNEILIWSSKNGQIIQKISPDIKSSMIITHQACRFPLNINDDLPYLLMSCENRVVLYAADTPSLFSSVEAHHMKIVALIQFPDQTFCTVSENEIGLWKIVHSKTPQKAHRTRSVSPRRKPFGSPGAGRTHSYKLHSSTQVDAVPLNGNGTTHSTREGSQYSTGDLLSPNKEPSRNSSYSSGGRDSPTLSSDCYLPTSVYAKIDNGKDMVEIFRDDIFHKKGHGLFQCAAVTDSGEMLACGTSDRKVALWDLINRKYLGEFSSHNGNLICLDFSKVDPWALLSGSEDHTVMMWDLEEEHKGKKEPQKNVTFSSVFIDPPDKTGYFISIFSTDKNSIQIYKDSKRLFDSVPSEPGAITATAIRKDGQLGIIVNEYGNIYEVQLQQIVKNQNPVENSLRLKLIGSTQKEKISHLAFNGSGSLFVAATVAGNILVFKNFQLLRIIKSESPDIVNIQFPLNMMLAIVCRNDIVLRLENLETGTRLKGWKIEEQIRVTCSTVGVEDNTEGALAIGTRRTGIFIFSLEANSGVVKASRLLCKHNTSIRSLQFSEDRTRLAVGHESGLITIWKQDNNKYEEELDLIFHKSRVRALAFSPDGKWLASCGDKLAFWTFEKPVHSLPKPSFMEERRRKKSGDNSSRPNSRLSLEIGETVKIGRKGKRELLQSFFFRGSFAQDLMSDPYFRKFAVVDDSGMFYIIEVFSNSIV